MKESLYNIHVEHKGQQLLFNSRTIATAVLDDPALKILDEIRAGVPIEETDLVIEMRRVGFLVDDDIDELKQIEMSYNLSKYQKSGLGLVIAPTMACNFACPYCFEGVQSGVMTKKTQDKVVSMVNYFAADGQDITITWFGGEPLLCKEDIYRMSEQMIDICEKQKVNYSAGIVTNGYNLDEECILRLKAYKVGFVQITLDGLPETHNKKRRLKSNPAEPTFPRILSNILLAKKHGMNVAIRVNVDKETQHELEPLLEMMVENNLGEDLNLGHVISNTETLNEAAQKQILDKYANKTVSDYINFGEVSLQETEIVPAAVTNKYIPNGKSFFGNLDTKTKMGYYSVGNGACGYVAAGLVLLYYDKYLDGNFIVNSTYLNSTGNAYKSNAFTKMLYEQIGVKELGYSNTLNASKVAKVMTTYLKNKRGISATCWSTVTVKPESIRYQLTNRGIPVVYVNRFNDPKNGGTTDHDIVVYGYDSAGGLISHFGWVGYEHVKCTSPALAAFVSSACAITYY